LLGRDDAVLSYDDNGNLTSDGTHSYTWNERNQLAGISGADTASYSYDALGRRSTAVINGQTTATLYDGWNPVQLQAGGVAVENRLMGLGLDRNFARTRSGVTESYLSDALGSTLELRDAAQNQTVEYTYDPYGNTASSAASTNGIKYTGREQDLEDLYYYRNRYYKPSVGRFISEDPIGLAGGSNTYAYVSENPVNAVDPLGLSEETMEGLLALGGMAALADGPLPVGDLVGAGIIAGGTIYLACSSKEIPKNALGPSGKPKIHNVDHPNRKSAKDAARNDGQGPPMHHPSPKVGEPHYHPTDANGNKIPGVHHNY